MVQAPRLRQRVSQHLTVTPRLRQAIALLQLNNRDLCAFIDRELERNPLLEIDTPVNQVASNALTLQTGTYFENVKQYPLGTNDSASIGHTSFDNQLARTDSSNVVLQDHLREQLNFEITDPIHRAIGLHLISMVNEDGYLVEDLDAVAKGLGCQQAQINLTLNRLQRFDPPGVFARNLGECLKLQMREIGQLNQATEILIDNLQLLAARNFSALAKLCAISTDEIGGIAEHIKTLNPKPGLKYHQAPPESIVPDVYTWRQPDGSWMVELNDSMFPKILVNFQYHTCVSQSGPSANERHYLNKQMQSANWLVRSLNQRANTILAVARELVRRQKGFLADGIKFMKPLTLRDVADNIHMHESTVSRANASKYISTPRGTFSFKYFFGPPIHSVIAGRTHSAEAVRYRIKSLIEKENPKAPITDRHIVTALRSEGVKIARRTVAKYRGKMRILSSGQRRFLRTS